MTAKRIILGISGASGATYGTKALELLRQSKVETHLVVSKSGYITLQQELGMTAEDVKKLADHHYAPGDIAAKISSGSFHTDGMLVAPCSMKALAEIATGLTAGLLPRAADVILKERRKLVLMVRETPLTQVHIQNMLTVTQMGGIIAPPVPAFYNNPQSLDDIVTHSVGRALELFGLEVKGIKRWQGL
ncbi:UbiX family flavin prenyltransferase [bacterium]|nr:UbiX family flavin prenyltransferase [bacterium]